MLFGHQTADNVQLEYHKNQTLDTRTPHSTLFILIRLRNGAQAFGGRKKTEIGCTLSFHIATMRPLPARLQVVHDMVQPVRVAADVGCENAMLAIALVLSGRAQKAIAVGEGQERRCAVPSITLEGDGLR